MADIVALRTAVDIAWSNYRATHHGIDGADDRRCLLERHLQRLWEERVGDADELASFGAAYLAQLLEHEC